MFNRNQCKILLLVVKHSFVEIKNGDTWLNSGLYKNSEELLLIRSKLVIRDKKLPSNSVLTFPEYLTKVHSKRFLWSN